MRDGHVSDTTISEQQVSAPTLLQQLLKVRA
jgi:hypothetical protein